MSMASWYVGWVPTTGVEPVVFSWLCGLRPIGWCSSSVSHACMCHCVCRCSTSHCPFRLCPPRRSSQWHQLAKALLELLHIPHCSCARAMLCRPACASCGWGGRDLRVLCLTRCACADCFQVPRCPPGQRGARGMAARTQCAHSCTPPALSHPVSLVEHSWQHRGYTKLFIGSGDQCHC